MESDRNLVKELLPTFCIIFTLVSLLNDLVMQYVLPGAANILAGAGKYLLTLLLTALIAVVSRWPLPKDDGHKK